MNDQYKTKAQLIAELDQTRKRVAELEHTEEELRESGERFKNFVETSTDLVFQLSKTAHIEYISPIVEELYGYQPDELIGKHIRTTTPVEEIPKALKSITTVLGNKSIRNFRINQRAKAGQIIPMEINAVPAKRGRKIVGVQGVMRNITERKQAEEALIKARDELELRVAERTNELAKVNVKLQGDITKRKLAEKALSVSELRYRSLVDNAGAGITIANIKGRLTYVNEALCKMMGYSEEELIGKPFANFLHPEDKKQIMKIFWNAWREPNREVKLEFRVIHKNGSVVHMHSRPTITFFKEEIIGFNAIITDITERKRAEEALRESEGKYRSLVESTDDAVYLMNQDMRYEFANGKYLTRLGLSLAELVGQEYGKLHPRDTTEEFVKEVDQVIKSGKPLTYEYLSHLDNRYFLRTLSPVIDEEQGEIRAITVTSKDITERIQAEQAIKRHTEDLTLLNDLNRAVNADASLEEILALLCERTKRIFSGHGTTIFLLAEDESLEMKYMPLDRRLAQKIERLANMMIPPVKIPRKENTLHWQVLKTRQARLLRDGRSIQRQIREYVNPFTVPNKMARQVINKLVPQIHRILGIKSVMLVPLISDNEVIGLINLASKDKLTETDLARLERLTELVVSIIKHKQAEEALRESEEKWRSLTEYSPDYIMLLDRDANILFINNTIPGLTRDEVIGISFYDYALEEYKEVTRECFERVLKTGECGTFESIYKHEDGTLQHFESHVGPVRRGDSIVGLTVSSRDITAQKLAEEELRVSEENYRTLFEQAPVGITTMDLKGVITSCNPTVYQEGGYSEEDLVGKHFSKVAPIRLRDIPRFIGIFNSIIKGETPKPFDTTYQRRDGTLGWTEIHPNLLKEGDKKLGIQVIQRDITERKQAEEELKRSNKKLKQFAFAASHDLQEPLKTITSFAQLLSERYKGQLDSSADEYLHYMVEGATQMSARIKGLLAVSRIEAKAMHLENVSLEAVLQQVLAGLKNLVEQSHAEITWDTLPEIRANRDQMAQLLQNLIENALKFRGTEDPRVHISSRTTTSTWEFYVQDNGIGIEPEYHERIFDLFHRVSRKYEHAGTGIGLAICQRIVERHGGRIWVESEGEGKGSRFCMSISKQVR